MDTDVLTYADNIRQIEDIIDIQKANGNISTRQVALNLLSNTDITAMSANIFRSWESGLFRTNSDNDSRKKCQNLRVIGQKSSMLDNVSWPSESDVTVLRMNLCVSDITQEVDCLFPGDGLHHRDSSSMVNLATLIRHSQTPSKPNINFEEYLMPLTSWEREHRDAENKVLKVKVDTEETQTDCASKVKEDLHIYDGVCSHPRTHFSEKDSNSEYSKIGPVSKFARFLRLYFCPCCTCLYRMEMGEDPFGLCANEDLKEV